MDWIGQAVIAAIVSAIVSIAVLVVSTWTARALHSKKLDSERTLAERRFEYDKDLAERKFRYERDLHDRGRRVELAEQALTAILEAKGALGFALIGARFETEDSTRKSQEEESIIQKKTRDLYFLPIQRLIPYNELFSKLNCLRLAFIAHFGEPAGEPFEEIFQVHQEIITAAKILINTVPSSEGEYQNWAHMNELLWSTLGWGPTMQNRVKLQLRIDKAVEAIEAICRPVLAQKAGE